jgi:hypothetical protein
MLGVVIGVVGLVISFFALLYARHSAASSMASAEAAARSAGAAEKAVDLQVGQLRDEWIDRLAEALPDEEQVGRLVRTIPTALSGDWRSMILAAYQRNPRMPAGEFSTFIFRLEEDLAAEEVEVDSFQKAGDGE